MRVEAEIKGKRAVVALDELVNGSGPGFVFCLIRRYLELRDRSELDSNKDRRM